MRIRNKLRQTVFARDGGLCRYCGGAAVEVDHVVPRSIGGTDDIENLAASCTSCNREKGAIPRPEADLPATAVALMAARNRAGRCSYHGAPGSQVSRWTEEGWMLEACGVSGCPPWRAYADGWEPLRPGDLAVVAAPEAE